MLIIDLATLRSHGPKGCLQASRLFDFCQPAAKTGFLEIRSLIRLLCQAVLVYPFELIKTS